MSEMVSGWPPELEALGLMLGEPREQPWVGGARVTTGVGVGTDVACGVAVGGRVGVIKVAGNSGLSVAIRIGAVVGLGRGVQVATADGVGVITTGGAGWAGA